MIRLSGLPSVDRFPRAAVSRSEVAVSIVFRGPDHETRIDVPLARLGPEEDGEAAELRLLAHLQKLGYRVEREAPPGSDAAT
jgi:hypothetical protein